MRVIKWLFLISIGVVIGAVLCSIFSGDKYEGEEARSGERLGVVEVRGFIANPDFVIRGLRRFYEDDSVKGVVIRVETPGGVVSPSQEIHDWVKKLSGKKPVVCSFGAVAASGGYYLSAPATRIIANPGTITGSIGVIAQFPQYSILMDKIGFRTVTIKSGVYKDSGNPAREMTPEDKAVLQSMIMDMFEQFVSAVAEGRQNLNRDEVLKLATGQVFSGAQALKNGLVDELGDYWHAVDVAKDLAGITGPLKLEHWREPEDGLLSLIIGKKARVAAEGAVDFMAASPIRYCIAYW